MFRQDSGSKNEPWPVAVFAHNEARHIRRNLERLIRSAENHPLDIYVLCNGCTDGTEALVEEESRKHPEIRLIRLPFPDKANAWNAYTHEHAPNSEIYFYTDGDVVVRNGALDALYKTLQLHPYANAAAALPDSGRNVHVYRRYITRGHGLAGGLYALRGSFVQRMREKGCRMPVGFIGEDFLITALAKWNLCPAPEWDQMRVAPCPSAKFHYESLSFWRLRDWRSYWQRRIRYNIRTHQWAMLVPRLIQHGLAAMPEDVDLLYKELPEKRRLYWRGRNTVFDWFAVRAIGARQKALRAEQHPYAPSGKVEKL